LEDIVVDVGVMKARYQVRIQDDKVVDIRKRKKRIARIGMI
jgi:hypothetical protein